MKTPESWQQELFTDFAALPGDYLDLLRQHATTFDQTDVWYSTFAQYLLGPAERLQLLGLRDPNEGAIALLPLRSIDVKQGLFTLASLESLSNYYTAHFAPVVDPRADLAVVSARLVGAIQSLRSDWSRIDLTPLAEDHPLVATCDAMKSRGCRVQRYFRFGNWYLEVAGRSFAEYFAGMPGRMRSTLTRKAKKLDARGDVRVEIVTTAGEVDRVMDDYERIYSLSWKQAEPHTDFIRAICRRFAEAGWLRLGAVYIGDRPAAAQIWYCYRGTASIFKLAYDPEFSDVSAGSVLTLRLMQHAFEQDRVSVVDYLCGDDEYKKDWMSHRRERWAVRVHPWLSTSSVSEVANSLAGRLTKLVSRSV
jgi:CelD/BcsL family acetyltransferase involved in cellulose biosynthesis